jgi:hypothetical protein
VVGEVPGQRLPRDEATAGPFPAPTEKSLLEPATIGKRFRERSHKAMPL